MNKLLTAYIFRLFKNKLFWIAVIFMAAVGAGFPLTNHHFMVKNDYPQHIDNSFFMGTVFIGVVLSVFCSLFVGTEYHDGTIRNKIIVGQKRPVIYVSNLLTCIFAGIILCSVCFLACLCVGIPLLGTFRMKPDTVLLFILCALLLASAFSSLFTFLTMVNQSKAASAVLCILTAFLLFFAATYIQAQLSEPEMYDRYVYMDREGNIVTEEPEPNPNYVSGTKREIYEFLNDFLLGGQSLRIAQMNVQHPWIFMFYSGITIVVTTGAGILIFQKKDLK